MTDPIFSLWDIISIIGYPVIGWLAWKGGQRDGVSSTIQALQATGHLSKDFGDDLNDDEE